MDLLFNSILSLMNMTIIALFPPCYRTVSRQRGATIVSDPNQSGHVVYYRMYSENVAFGLSVPFFLCSVVVMSPKSTLPLYSILTRRIWLMLMTSAHSHHVFGSCCACCVPVPSFRTYRHLERSKYDDSVFVCMLLPRSKYSALWGQIATRCLLYHLYRYSDCSDRNGAGSYH